MTSAYADSHDELQQDIAVPVEHSADGVEPGTRAVIYLRVSSTGQVKTDYDPEGISIPAQREACLRKAKDLGLTVIDEYVEPGRSATEMTKREAFQRMLARVRAQGDVDYVIVYMLSRMARNRYDDAIVMADLRKRGVTLVSATEAVDDSPVGQLMHGILATFNEYQSRQSGADIANKMGQKARTGGTLGRAKIGYLNHIDHSDGRVIRTIVLDDERAPLVQLAFELYDTGDYTLDELADELYDRGLRTRPTAKHPAKKVSINKLSQMLRDRYYLGYVTYKGEEVRGRHEPLIDEDLFDRVQDRINSRSAAKERRRVHHHYLKGSLFCGRCRRAGVTQRMIIQRTVNSKGAEYLYFFCRNRQNSTCDAPHVNAELVEDAVERHYTTIHFSQSFISDVRTQIDTVISEQEKSARLLHQQLSTQLAELDTQEENVIDLAADGTLPQTKVKAKLRDIERQRRHLNQRLDTASADLTDAARLIDVSLKLLERPEELYRRCNDEQRRLLNQAIFHNIYIEDEEVTDHDFQEPFSQLHAIQQTQRSTPHTQQAAPSDPEPQDSKKATRQAGGPSSPSGVAVLLQGLQSGTCSSNTSKVDLRSSFSNPRKPLGSLISRVLRGSQARRPRARGARMADERGPVRENSRQSQTRLSVSNRAKLLAGYADGVPVRELATRFNVHRGTVREIARQAGLAARRPELPDAIRQDAAQLYAGGMTLAQVAARLGVSNESVRSAVLACGGTIRPGGRRRVGV